jgi:transcriptional regulator CtsR
MEEANELHAQALIDCVALLLFKHGCITDKEAEGLLDWALEEDMLTAEELQNLILGLEERALSCDDKEVALTAVKLLKEAWKELNDSMKRGLTRVGNR